MFLKKLHQVEVNKEKDIKQEIIIIYIVINTLVKNPVGTIIIIYTQLLYIYTIIIDDWLINMLVFYDNPLTVLFNSGN